MRKNEDFIAIYSRKSKFTGKGESIDNQVELCKQYIRDHYGEQAVERCMIYEDEGFSGGNMQRPAFQEMMKAAEQRKFKAIVVYRLDRISRNVSDFSILIETLKRLDINFVSIREIFDTSTPLGIAMMYIASVFSQLERETIAERIRDNMHELAKTGRWLGGTTPTGYTSKAVKSITIDDKEKKSYKLKLIPEEAEIVRTIYALYIQFDSLTSTETELLRRGIKTKKGNKFSRFAIKGILQNPVYAMANQDVYNYFIKKDAELFSSQEAFDGVHGIMAYNRTNQEKGRAAKILPITEWIVTVGKHPGIISGKTWVTIQESLERNKCKAYRKPRKNEALLSGILFCSCGEHMYPKISKRKTPDGKPIYTYVCKMKETSRRSICDSKNINGNVLDDAVMEQIKSLAEDKSTFLQQLEQSKRFYAGDTSNYEDQLTSAQKEKSELEKKINALVDSLTELHDSSAKEHIIHRMEQFHQKLEQVETHIHELEELLEQQTLHDHEFIVLQQLLTDFRRGVDAMTIEQKRAAIRTLVRKIIWNNGTVQLILFGVQDDELDLTFPSKTHLCEDSK